MSERLYLLDRVRALPLRLTDARSIFHERELLLFFAMVITSAEIASKAGAAATMAAFPTRERARQREPSPHHPA